MAYLLACYTRANISPHRGTRPVAPTPQLRQSSLLDLAAIRPIYPFAQRWLDLPHGRMHYLDEGQGSPVIMLHGNPTWSFYYRRLISALRERHRVIVPDHLGCGLS